jgi:inhibitor of Bruton tyrosine kinase
MCESSPYMPSVGFICKFSLKVPLLQDGESGWSSLHRALHFGHLSVAGVLLQFGASLTLEDTKGRTPIDLISCPVSQVNGDSLDAGKSLLFYR